MNVRPKTSALHGAPPDTPGADRSRYADFSAILDPLYNRGKNVKVFRHQRRRGPAEIVDAPRMQGINASRGRTARGLTAQGNRVNL
jgi:hypothetical protein